MDSITQIVLGAAVGEAIAGKKAGFKGVMWGALIGTLPDLDVIAEPFLDGVGEIHFHRSITHNIFFSLLMAPVFGWIIQKIHYKENTTIWLWAKLAFWVLLTHILIDLATTYGTQIFYPVSDTPFALDSIFIIDPLYTLPLIFGLIIAFIYRRKTRIRRWANYSGLIISSLYIIIGIGIKAHVHEVFKQSFSHQYGYLEQAKTTPAGPSILLWSGYVVKQDTVYQALYSVFDKSQDLQFRSIPQNSNLIEPYENDRAIETLLWFSRGYYTVEEEHGKIIFYDLRFGRGDFWLTEEESELVWRNELLMNELGEAHDVLLTTPSLGTRSSILQRYWKRLWGY